MSDETKATPSVLVVCGHAIEATMFRHAATCDLDVGHSGDHAAIRMDGYYISFGRTGDPAIDRILSAVACAGKAYHLTQDWNEECEPYESVHRGKTPVEWIQNAADDAAAARDALKKAEQR